MSKRFLSGTAGAFLLAFTLATPLAADEELKQSGTISIDQVEVAFLLSGNLGGGELHYEGKTYRFTIGGLGVGGIGASSLEASGEVYDLKQLADFPGVYGAVRYGAVAGNAQAKGEVWLQNPEGVRIRLDPHREGLMLTAGADGIVITMDD